MGEYHRKWREANQERIKATRKAYYALHEDDIKAQSKAYAEANPLRVKTRVRTRGLKQYGLTEEQYQELLLKQDSKCACCNSAEPGGPWKRFAVDHDHTTNKIRGLLCFSCNTGIGNLGDSIAGVTRALDYLKRAE